MPAWFSKVFKNNSERAATAVATPGDPAQDEVKSGAARWPNPILEDDEFVGVAEAAPQRRIIHPTVLTDEPETAATSNTIRIKACVEKDQRTCVFMVDRMLLDGYSAYFTKAADAQLSPLAQSLYGLSGVETVLIHGMNVTVTRSSLVKDSWEALAKEIGARIRAHVQTGQPAVSPEFLANLPPEDEIQARLEQVLEMDINPGIAAHSGVISLERIEGNTVYIRMMGGCQGCAASSITLRQGVHQAFREVVPQVGAILDVTDHASGKNPFYKALPAGMSGNA